MKDTTTSYHKNTCVHTCFWYFSYIPENNIKKIK